MKKYKNSIFYISVIGGFSALLYWIILWGSKLETGRNIIIPYSGNPQWNEFIDALLHNLQHPLAILLAQIITIIFVARIFGWICLKIGQPTVIGEMVAGIVLGPSLLGMYFPEISATLFPKESLGNLQFLSQIGLILFMFIVGMELDLKVMKNRAHEALVISHASIVIPFALGMGLAYFIYQNFAPESIQFTSFGLFIGIAMSITAFPVLVRIVQERGIQKTRLGTVVITCAAADDITAWCILAAVIAIVKAGSFGSALYTIALAIVYVFLMISVIRPFLKRVGDLHTSREKLSKPIVAIFFITLIISAYAAEVIGIHALFGAFMAGAVMPDNIKFRNIFIEKVEDVATVLLLPLFFVFTGLRTQIGLLNDPYQWKICGLIILVAVVGKFLGSAISARFVGQSWKESLSIGALMNTRGLMELVVLNIGYDLGVLKPEIFAMMVIMALVTTFMTGPALDIINKVFKSKKELIPQENSRIGKFNILISFGNSERGKSLLRLANGLIRNVNANVTALHLSPVNEINRYRLDEYQEDSFNPIIQESKDLNQKIITLFKASNDIDSEIIEIANKGKYDLLLMGAGQSIFEGSVLGKILGFTTRIINPERIISQVAGKENLFENSLFDERTRIILSRSEIPVGVLIDKDFHKPEKIFIPVMYKRDVFLIQYALKFIENSGSQVIIADIKGLVKSNSELKESLESLEQIAPNQISLFYENIIKEEFLKEQDLMIISIDGWKKVVELKNSWLLAIPSTLIMKDKALPATK